MSSISVILRAVSAARGAVSPLCSVFTPLITPAAFFAYLPPSSPPALPAGECWSQVSLCKSCRQFVSRARTETISGREVRLRLVTSVLSRGDVNNPTPHFSLRQVLSDNKTCSRARESSRERGSQTRPPPPVCWSSLS